MSHCDHFQPYPSCDLQNNFNYVRGLFDTHNGDQILQMDSSTYYSSSTTDVFVNYIHYYFLHFLFWHIIFVRKDLQTKIVFV